MRKIFKKIVTVVAAAAMMVGTIAGMPTTEAKAGELVAEKTIYVSVPTDSSAAINVWSGLDAGSTPDNAVVNWCKNMTKVQDGLYKITGNIYDDFGDGIQVVVIKDDAEAGQYKADATEKKVNWAAIKASILSTSSTDVWLTLVDGTYTLNVGSPVTITATDAKIAADAEALIDTALSKDATPANKAAYSAAKAAYDSLTAAQKALVPAAKVTSLTTKLAAITASEAGKLTIYVTSEDNWSEMNVYGWDGADFGAWPGKTTTACTKNAGWFSLSFDITTATNLIFNANKDGDSNQTIDLKNITAGTYWVTVKKSVEGAKCEAEFSTTAPAGWVDEAADNIEQSTTNNDTTTAPTTGDTTPVIPVVAAIALLGLAVVIMNTKKANR